MNPRQFFLAAIRRLAIALAAPVLLAACGAEEQAQPPIRPVETVVVRTGALSGAAGFAGEVRARHESDLAFRVGGKVIERRVDAGAIVRKGALLARLDPQDAALSAQAARAQVVAAEAEHALAKAEFERYTQLYEQKFVSQAVLDARQSAYNAARAKLAQARAQASVSGNQSAYTALRAGHDGIVTAVNLEVGQVVAAGQPVLRFARPEEKEVLINVPENRIDEVREAGAAVIALWADTEKRYTGRVREVSPTADAATRTFPVRVTIENADSVVKLGMTANVLFSTEEADGVALVPLTAVLQKEGRASVWVVDPDHQTVGLRAVEIAAYREDGAVIASGLRDGERIVSRGVHKLLPGQRVRLYQPEGAALAIIEGQGAGK